MDVAMAAVASRCGAVGALESHDPPSVDPTPAFTSWPEATGAAFGAVSYAIVTGARGEVGPAGVAAASHDEMVV